MRKETSSLLRSYRSITNSLTASPALGPPKSTYHTATDCTRCSSRIGRTQSTFASITSKTMSPSSLRISPFFVASLRAGSSTSAQKPPRWSGSASFVVNVIGTRQIHTTSAATQRKPVWYRKFCPVSRTISRAVSLRAREQIALELNESWTSLPALLQPTMDDKRDHTFLDHGGTAWIDMRRQTPARRATC